MVLTHDRVIVFDTTLREGELVPGIRFDLPQKIEIARQLERVGVEIIEVGYPGKSEKDLSEMVQISQQIDRAILCGLARTESSEILKVVRAIKAAPRGRIHLYSNVRLPPQLHPEIVLGEIETHVRLARTYCDDVQWSAFDATRSDRQFLCRAISIAIENGATTIGIPDSLGVALPDEFSSLIQIILELVPHLDRAILSVHCHDDRHCAADNTIAALNCGARQIECTIDGLGPRKGNTDLARILRAIADRTQLKTSIRTQLLPELSAYLHQILPQNIL